MKFLNFVLFKLSRKVIDKCQPDTTLPCLHFKVFLKDNKELTDLKLTFNGINEPMSLLIATYELEQKQETTSK